MNTMQIVIGFFLVVIGIYVGVKHSTREKEGMLNALRKYYESYRIMDIWMTELEEGNYLFSKIKESGINNIAIYGTGKMGRHLIMDAEKAGLTINYVIDKNKKAYTMGYVLYKPEESLPNVDLIINSVLGEDNKINESILQNNKYRIISVSELF